MNAVNLFEATEVLERARREVMGAEHEADERIRKVYGVESDMDVMLMEYDKPSDEPFPDKSNRKYVESKVKGNTPLTDIRKLKDS